MKKSALLLLAFLVPLPAHAWFPKGHSTIAAAATNSLPAEVPAWFRGGAAAIAHSAQDPDIHKTRDLPVMTEEEAPQHFFDSELLQGRPLPPTRKEFARLCTELKIDPADVGELPYALAEWTQRLTITFAEARRYPDNPFIQQKALVYAGILSHYSGDCTMPLHTTVDHDGRALPGGKSPRSGIHARVDSLIERLNLTPADLQVTNIEAIPALIPGIQSEFSRSQTQINRAYELEAMLPPRQKEGAVPAPYEAPPAVREFTLERGRAGARFTAQLFLSAWRDSARIKLPDWYEREGDANSTQQLTNLNIK